MSFLSPTSWRRGKPPIIIGGCHRSGTTLLRRILDAHSHIHCPPEVKFFSDFFGDYTDDPLAHVRYFATARQMGLSSQDILVEHGRTFVRCHERAARSRGRRRWADKNPENVLYLDQWQRILRRPFQFVHVVRHPLDVLASLVEAGFDKSIPLAFEDKVALVQRYFMAGMAWVEGHPRLSFTLRYEELVVRPEEVLASLFAFLGEPYEARVLKEFNAPQRQKGIEDPKVSGTSEVHNQSVGRWKKDLSPEESALARDSLAEILLHYDYQVSP